MSEKQEEARHWYPKAEPTRQPTPWWYFGRAVYVSRRDYRKIFNVFAATGVALGAVNVLRRREKPLREPLILAEVGLAMLGYSLLGLYRMYGHPAVQYLQKLLDLGNVAGPVTVADLHIGTYRHAYLLAELLPDATIHTVDCWHVDGPPAEEAVEDVRALESAPVGHPRIHPHVADDFSLPLADESADVVVFGFGTHEIPEDDGSRDRLFREASRLLKPGGTLLLFEHGYDFHNYLIFGPVIKHVTRKDDWDTLLRTHFADVRYARATHAVDLFAARKRA
jgi:SAM-dependent methyltransferase